MALQNDKRSSVDRSNNWMWRCNYMRLLNEAISGIAKLFKSMYYIVIKLVNFCLILLARISFLNDNIIRSLPALNWRAPTSIATIHNLPFGLNNFAKPDIASQKSKYEVMLIHLVINNSTPLLASILRSHVWRHKAPKPVVQIVDRCATTWNPSTIVIYHLIRTIVYETFLSTVLQKISFLFWLNHLNKY